jgi:hypothetical protein
MDTDGQHLERWAMAQILRDHAMIIKSAIDNAETDGFDVTLENECCGCSKMTLEISAKEDLNGHNSVVIARGV